MWAVWTKNLKCIWSEANLYDAAITSAQFHFEISHFTVTYKTALLCFPQNGLPLKTQMRVIGKSWE